MEETVKRKEVLELLHKILNHKASYCDYGVCKRCVMIATCWVNSRYGRTPVKNFDQVRKDAAGKLLDKILVIDAWKEL